MTNAQAALIAAASCARHPDDEPEIYDRASAFLSWLRAQDRHALRESDPSRPPPPDAATGS